MYAILPWVYSPFVRTKKIFTKPCIIHRVIASRNETPTPIYYINLDASKDRNARFLDRLEKTLIPIRVPAVTPETIPKLIKPSIKCITTIDTEYACLASHLKAIHKAYHDGREWAIISEDDAVINHNVDWLELIKSAPTNWDVLQIHTCCIPRNAFNKQTIFKNFSDENNLWVSTSDIVPSCAFYIINVSGMIKILSEYVRGHENNNWYDIDCIDLRSTKINCQADLILFHKLQRYVCTYQFVDVDKSKSTIHWTHDWNHYDYV